MITWFDALLVTVWAAVTALGARRGLSGLLWGLGGAGACFLANLLGRGPLPALALAGGLGLGLAVLARRLVPTPRDGPAHLAAGALGGFALGGILVATLALGFPTGVQVGPQGKTGVYPSANLPPLLYSAVNGSVLKGGLMRVWDASFLLRTLIVPDQTRR